MTIATLVDGTVVAPACAEPATPALLDGATVPKGAGEAVLVKRFGRPR